MSLSYPRPHMRTRLSLFQGLVRRRERGSGTSLVCTVWYHCHIVQFVRVVFFPLLKASSSTFRRACGAHEYHGRAFVHSVIASHAIVSDSQKRKSCIISVNPAHTVPESERSPSAADHHHHHKAAPARACCWRWERDATRHDGTREGRRAGGIPWNALPPMRGTSTGTTEPLCTSGTNP